MPNQKNTVEYFPFFARDGKTLYVLQRKYGLAGIGFFTQIMRWLAQAPSHYYEYNDEYDKDRLNEFIGMSELDVRAMISDMVQTGKVDRELWEDRGVIYSQDFVDSLEMLYRRRRSEMPTRELVLEETASLCRHTDNILTQDAQLAVHDAQLAAEDVVQRKVKERKGKEREEQTTPSAEPDGSSGPPASTQPQRQLSKLKDSLANWYQDAFTAVQPASTWSSVKQERGQLTTLAKKTRALLADTPFDDEISLARAIMHSYYNARDSSQHEYWASAPFTPAGLSTRWDKVVTRMARDWEGSKRWEEATA